MGWGYFLFVMLILCTVANTLPIPFAIAVLAFALLWIGSKFPNSQGKWMAAAGIVFVLAILATIFQIGQTFWQLLAK